MSVYTHADSRTLARAILNEALQRAQPKADNRDLIQTDLIEKISITLEQLSYTSDPTPSTFRGKIGDLHFKTSKGLISSIVAAVTLALTSIDSGHVTVGASVAAVVAYLGVLKELLTKLNLSEREVYEAVALAVEEKLHNGIQLEAKDVTISEISHWLPATAVTSEADLQHILDDLVIKDALTRTHGGGQPARYRCVH